MKLPVIMVTGFLGSGKTTFLKRIAENHPELRLMFLVNEFADTDVDGQTLSTSGRPALSIVGGSLFCECNAAEFISVMKEEVLTRHRSTPLDALIIETSGIADPHAIGNLIDDFGLQDDVSIERIISIIAPARFSTMLKGLPNIAAQIQCSDQVIINKCDTVATDRIREVIAQISTLNPDAEVLQATYCRLPFSLPGRSRIVPHGALSTCDSNPFTTRTMTGFPVCSEAALLAWLHALPAEILRAKGPLTTQTGRLNVDYTLDGIHVRHAPALESTSAPDALVLICHEAHQALLDSILPPSQSASA